MAGDPGGNPIPVEAGGLSNANGKQVMQQLAQQTGGRFYEVSKHESIEQIYTSIGEELRNQYSLGFTPEHAEADDGYHKILVTTTQKDLTVQARDGYYSGNSGLRKWPRRLKRGRDAFCRSHCFEFSYHLPKLPLSTYCRIPPCW